jgi:hypothetical protein
MAVETVEKLVKRRYFSWFNQGNKLKLRLDSPRTRKILRVAGSLVLGTGIFYFSRKIKVAFAVDVLKSLNTDFPKTKVKRSWGEFFKSCKDRFIPSTYKSKLIFLASTLTLATVIGLNLYLKGLKAVHQHQEDMTGVLRYQELNELVDFGMAIIKRKKMENNEL